MVFIIGPYSPRTFNHVPSLVWLRYQARQGRHDRRHRYRLHDYGPGRAAVRLCLYHALGKIQEFKQDNPRITVTSDIFEIQGGRISCAGGCASMDMMLYLIEQQHGHELSVSVAESMIHSNVRAPDQPQRADLKTRTGVSDPTLLEVIELMEANIEEPLSSNELALLTRVSRRKLERLFSATCKARPGTTTSSCGWMPGQQMLRNTSLKILEVALACGFRSPGHFSARYRARFGRSPREERKQ